jgi:hypothetical protein
VSLYWLLFQGRKAWREQHAAEEPFQLDEANLALAIESVIKSDDTALMVKALRSIHHGLIRPRTKSPLAYRLAVVSPRRGPKEDFGATINDWTTRIAIAQSVYRRQIIGKGRMKRAVAETAIEFSQSKASIYRAIGRAKDDLLFALDGEAPPESKFYLAQFMGFVQGETFDPERSLLSHDFEKWLYGFAGAPPEDEG